MWNEKFAIKELDITERIIRNVKDEVGREHIPQPIFIVGDSGAGKSTILRLLHSILEKDENVEAPFMFDGKSFFNSQDIIRAIEAMSSQNKRSLTDNDNGERKIVMIDNLDYYFHRTSFDDQYVLRRYLNREAAPLLIATVSVIDDDLADYRAPFFEGVRIMYIPEFDKSSWEETGIPLEMTERLSTLMKLLPPVVRSYKMASEIISLSNDRNADIGLLLDRVGPDYRRSFESIPVNSQKILVALAASETPMSLSQLRQFTGMQSGILSSYLRQLLKSGKIRKIQSDKHGSPYEICDRLFKLWLVSDYNKLETYLNK